MACNIQEHKRKVITHFENKNLLVGVNEIPTDKLKEFEVENNRLTQYAKENKDTDVGKIFNVKKVNDVFKAVINNAAIESIQSFNEEIDFIDKKKNFNDLLGSEEIFNPEIKEIENITKGVKYRHINDNLEINKLEKTSNNILNLLNTFFTISERKGGTYNEKIGRIINDIDGLKEKYKNYEDSYHTFVVAKYVKFMRDQMNSFNKRLNSKDLKFNSQLHDQMQNYLSSFGLINEINTLVDELSRDKVINDKKYKQYKKELRSIISLFQENKDRLDLISKDYLLDNFSSVEYFKEDYLRYKDMYSQEAKRLYKGKENKSARENYVNRMLSENRSEIETKTKERFRYLIETSKEDIGSIASKINSEKSLNNPIIQIISRLLDKNELEYTEEIFPKFREMDDFHAEYMKGKKGSSDKIFKKFIDVSKSGTAFLKGDYKIEFIDQHQELLNNITNALEKYGLGSKQHETAVKNKKVWIKNNTIKSQNSRIPTNKWRNNFNEFSDKDREYYEHIKSIANESNENTKGLKSLKKMYFNVPYYKLPSVRKSNLTRLQSGKAFSSLRELAKEAITRQADDVNSGEINDSDFIKAYTDLSGNEVNYIPIHYRYTLPIEEQSFDLSTIYAMDLESTVKFKHRNRIESDVNLFLDVIKKEKFTVRKGVMNRIATSVFGKEGQPIEINGTDSNVVKLIDTMMQNRLYDKISANKGAKVGQVDINKLSGTLLGYTSHIGMALNYFGATANFAIGSVNNMIESFAGDIIDKNNIANGLAMYSKNISGLMADVGSTANKNIINQLLEKYNIFGDIQNLKQEFEKNNKLKSLFKGDSLQFMHNIGEHGMQAVLTLAVLDSVKVLDSKGNFLDKNGKITKNKSNAISLREAYIINEKGNLDLSLKFDYTSLDTLNKFKEGGDNNVRGLIKQMLLRNHGNYDSRIQSEFQRHWYGKMIMMYKKHIESPMLNRWRGLGSSLKKREDLDGSNYRYNYDLGKIDEGHYTSMIRYIARNVIPNLKALKLKLIVTDFNNLENWEKANLKRTMSEAAIMGMVWALSNLLAAVADDDDEAVWFAAYTFRRMESDLKQFHNPSEAWRILKNPFASLKQIELVTKLAETIITPWTWNDVYEGGPYKGDSVLGRRVLKLTPVLTRKDLTAKQAYSFLDRN